MGQDCTQATGTPEAVLIDFYATLEECLLICNFSMQWTSGVLLCIASGKLPTIKPIFTEKKKKSKAWHAEQQRKGENSERFRLLLFEHFFVLYYPPAPLHRTNKKSLEKLKNNLSILSKNTSILKSHINGKLWEVTDFGTCMIFRGCTQMLKKGGYHFLDLTLK